MQKTQYYELLRFILNWFVVLFFCLKLSNTLEIWKYNTVIILLATSKSICKFKNKYIVVLCLRYFFTLWCNPTNNNNRQNVYPYGIASSKKLAQNFQKCTNELSFVVFYRHFLPSITFLVTSSRFFYSLTQTQYVSNEYKLHYSSKARGKKITSLFIKSLYFLVLSNKLHERYLVRLSEYFFHV